MPANRPIDFTGYPIRTCQSLHCCDRCGESITLGQLYYDGGYGRRAHVTCVGALRDAEAEEVRNLRAENANLRDRVRDLERENFRLRQKDD